MRRESSAVKRDARFAEVVALIEAARLRAARAVNVELIELYWQVGAVISRRIESDGWGKGTVQALSAHVVRTQPGMRGFSPQNLWRMRQFFETYRDDADLSTLVRELPWSANLHILSGTKLPEEREFYLRVATKIITELGRDFCFVGSEYPVQVGKQDFAVDLVFFHRGLSCLVAFELKVRKFKPEDLGKLSFYVEALDRDVKKSHERPSIGVLLCATKDDEVVEYALSRTTSPTLVAEYQTMLPPKAVLRRKLHELYAQLRADAPDPERGKKRRR